MKTYTVKTIDVNAKEWFDKLNGNSYFSAVVTVNFSMPNEEHHFLSIQYGYGQHYKDMALRRLQVIGIIPNSVRILWQHCQDNNIILRTSKQENCLKRDLAF